MSDLPTTKLALSMLCENPRRPTGLSTLFPEMMRAARRLRPDVGWIVFAGPEQAWPLEDPAVEVVRDYPANDRPNARLWADHWSVGPAAAARGARALLTTGFVPWRAPLPVAMQVITLHHLRENFEGGALRRIYRGQAVRSGMRRAALVLANSQYTADRLAAEYGTDAKIKVSLEGIDHVRFHPRAAPDETAAMQQRWNLAPGYVLWASNFYDYKQAGLLLEAYARLPEALRARHPLVLIGGDWHGGRAAAQRRAQELGLAAHTRFLDWVEQQWLPAFFRQAALHALPSAEETFGRSVSDAMACGCPCVVNDIPALVEVGAGAVRVVDFKDTDAATAALRTVLEDREQAAAMSRHGVQRAAQFTFERLAGERVEMMLRLGEGAR